MARVENLFFNGMHSDNEVSLQPEGTYRDANNVRLTNLGGNNYAIENIKGTSVSFTPTVAGSSSIKALGFCSFVDKMVVLFHETDGSGNYHLRLGTVTFTAAGVGTYSEKWKKQYTATNIRRAEMFAIRENDNVETVYWFQDGQPPRALNIADSGVSSIPLALTEFTPRFPMGAISFVKIINGNLSCGVRQYAYRLTHSDQRVATGWSYPTKPIVTPESLYGSTSEDYAKHQGGDTGDYSNHGIQIQVTDINNSTYDNIEVVCYYSGDRDVAGLPVEIFKGAITGTSMTFNHVDDDHVGVTLTDNDFLVRPIGIEQVKTGDTVKNRNTIGNIVEEADISYDLSDNVSIAEKQYILPADYAVPTALPYAGIKPASSSGIASGDILPDQWYYVSGGDVTYQGTNYGDTGGGGAYFQGVQASTANFDTYAVASGSPVVKAVIRIRKFNPASSADQYDYIELEDDYYDYKGAAVSHYLRGYMRGETYRFGVVLYTKRGNPLFVKWLDDVAISDQSTYALLKHQGQSAGGTDYYGIRALGLTFDNINLSEVVTALGISASDLPNYISGFSIVRAVRDKRSVAQGMLFPVHKVAVSAGNYYIPIASPMIQDSSPSTTVNTGESAATMSDVDDQTYMFYSPELMFEKNNADFVKGDELEIADYYRPFASSGTHHDATRTAGQTLGNDVYYQKYYEVNLPGSSEAKNSQTEILAQVPVNAGENLAPGWHILDPLDGYFRNDANTSVTATDPRDGILGNYNWDNDNGTNIGHEVAAGCKGTILITKQASHFGTGLANVANKAICNIVRDNSNPYGGETDSSKANTVYISTGHYQPINSTVYSQNDNSWDFDGIEVWGGDTYVNLYDFQRMIGNDQNVAAASSFSHSVIFPVESELNLNLRQGTTFNRNGSYYQSTGGESGINANPDNERPENFIYNEAYSTEEGKLRYIATPLDFDNVNTYEQRARYSEKKFIGETIDNYRRFLSGNYIDVNMERGSLNNLRAKNDTLFYWQDAAIGYIPVSERALIPSALGDTINLGDGAVFSRFDEISSYHGSYHQWSLVETENSFVWFDMRNRAICELMAGSAPFEISTAKGLYNYLKANTHYELFSNDDPLGGIGVHAVYDRKNKEVVMHFAQSSVSDFTISYNNINKKFQSFVDLYPVIMYAHEEWVIGWLSGDDFHVHNEGSYGDFYGTEYDSDITIIVNPARSEVKVFDTHELLVYDTNANGEFFDQIDWANSFQTAQDASIVVSSNRNYSLRDRRWLFNIARDSSRRHMRDDYLQVKFTKDNAADAKINIVSLLTNFRISR